MGRPKIWKDDNQRKRAFDKKRLNELEEENLILRAKEKNIARNTWS
jgi:hypothetical protein